MHHVLYKSFMLLERKLRHVKFQNIPSDDIGMASQKNIGSYVVQNSGACLLLAVQEKGLTENVPM
jgi:hypothetical protein